MQSSLALLKQQSKADWIRYKDQSTKFFMAKIKQRKMANYIYALNDDTGKRTKGFEEFPEILINFYKGLLGSNYNTGSI